MDRLDKYMSAIVILDSYFNEAMISKFAIMSSWFSVWKSVGNAAVSLSSLSSLFLTFDAITHTQHSQKIFSLSRKTINWTFYYNTYENICFKEIYLRGRLAYVPISMRNFILISYLITRKKTLLYWRWIVFVYQTAV